MSHKFALVKHKRYEDPAPSSLDDEYATSPPTFAFFSTGGGATFVYPGGGLAKVSMPTGRCEFDEVRPSTRVRSHCRVKGGTK